ncbi:hypothetical protein OG239_41805 (plasmid) [Streptomyces sp. NBC_00868]|nr:hypothetical protein OG239_41805 [Streptomyces sp. NBC_00868]
MNGFDGIDQVCLFGAEIGMEVSDTSGRYELHLDPDPVAAIDES